MQPIDHKIFRAYDIRGRAHEQLTAEACHAIAKAFGTELCERYTIDAPTVCVGRDARVSGPEFEEQVVRGLTESGCTVLRIGQTPSPVNYFTICTQELDGGIQITASHNPAHDNGLKLSLRGAEAFAGEEIQHLRKRIEAWSMRDAEGTVENFDGETPYVAYLQNLFGDCGSDLTVAVDGGNGVAGPLYCKVLRACGANVIELYTEPDGTFPNHPADPSKHSTLVELQKTLKEEEADIGLAFDGDGDRLGLVDEMGKIRTADEILLLLSQDHLSRFPGSPVVFTVSNSGILQTEIAALGGKPIMCKVGHSFVEHAMRDSEALLGGEQSGHFFCGEDYFAFDDALVAALRTLSIVKASQKTLGELCDAFPVVYQAPERRPAVPDEHKGRVVSSVIDHFQKTHDVDVLDGARIDFGDGAWAGIRQSNTSPCISICIEARTPEKLKEVEEMILSHFEKYPDVDFDAAH